MIDLEPTNPPPVQVWVLNAVITILTSIIPRNTDHVVLSVLRRYLYTGAADNRPLLHSVSAWLLSLQVRTEGLNSNLNLCCFLAVSATYLLPALSQKSRF